MDRTGVEKAWSALAHRLDPIHGDRDAEALLRDPNMERSGIERALDHIRMIDRETDGAVESMGYAFVWDTGLWRRATEANFQARALQQLCQWRTIVPGDAMALSGIVVRHSFSTNLSFSTPRYLMQEGVHFVVIPHVYLELLMLSAGALEEMIAGSEDDAWSRLAKNDPSAPSDPPPALRQLLARLLTDHAFHASEPGENPVARLQAQSTWFHLGDGERAPRSLETHLAYSALDFALAHEIGHRMLTENEPEMAQGTALERSADHIGFRLFAASWGWRDDVLESCPLSVAARVRLGPIWFFSSATLLLHLQSILGRRLVAVAPGAKAAGNLSAIDGHLAALAERWDSQRSHLSKYGQAVGARGDDVSPEDVKMLNAMTSAIAELKDSLPRWIEAIPDADLRFAASLREI